MVQPFISPVSTNEKDAIDHCFGHSTLFDSRDTLAKQYAMSQPYLHLKLNNFMDPQLLRLVRKEILEHLKFTEKETDIYQINQTGDLVNMDGLSEVEQQKLLHLSVLRNALYSAQFRGWVSHVTGCGELSGEQQDLSVNAYTLGCYLLNHDDVIGTRRVSYIIYLTDPDESWEKHFGGALELYPCASPGVPAACPSTVYSPEFNQCVLFTVQPGLSFHAVQEVVDPKAVRLSVSGWFHAVDGKNDIENQGQSILASLAQLETPSQPPVQTPTTSFLSDPDSLDSPLTATDHTYLSTYITDAYLSPLQCAKLSATFSETSLVQLTSFLNTTWSHRLLTYVLEQDHHATHPSPITSYDAPAGWAVVGNPVHARYLVPTHVATEPLAPLHRLLDSPAFRRWLYQVTGCTLTARHAGCHVRRFRPGFDYTLATGSPTSMLDVWFQCTPVPWTQVALGGYVCYVSDTDGSANAEDEDPAVYQGGASANVLATLAPQWNVLDIVVRESGVKPFVKYLRHRAPCCRWEMVVQGPVELAGDEEE